MFNWDRPLDGGLAQALVPSPPSSTLALPSGSAALASENCLGLERANPYLPQQSSHDLRMVLRVLGAGGWSRQPTALPPRLPPPATQQRPATKERGEPGAGGGRHGAARGRGLVSPRGGSADQGTCSRLGEVSCSCRHPHPQPQSGGGRPTASHGVRRESGAAVVWTGGRRCGGPHPRPQKREERTRAPTKCGGAGAARARTYKLYNWPPSRMAPAQRRAGGQGGGPTSTRVLTLTMGAHECTQSSQPHGATVQGGGKKGRARQGARHTVQQIHTKKG